MINNLRGDQLQFIKQIKQSVILDRNDIDSLMWLAVGYTMNAGKAFAAVPVAEKFLQIDPLNPNAYMVKGLSYFFDGRFDLALEPFFKSCQMDPISPPHQFLYAQTLLLNNRGEEAFKIIDKVEKAIPDHPFTQFGVLLRSAIQGDRSRLNSLGRELLTLARRDPYFPTLLAEDYALLDEKEEALNWLEHAINRGNFNYPFFNEHDPLLENIRGEPRFKKLMEKIKPVWQDFDA
jgi:tetratricopeptide (TPR) repeat protein